MILNLEKLPNVVTDWTESLNQKHNINPSHGFCIGCFQDMQSIILKTVNTISPSTRTTKSHKTNTYNLIFVIKICPQALQYTNDFSHADMYCRVSSNTQLIALNCPVTTNFPASPSPHPDTLKRCGTPLGANSTNSSRSLPVCVDDPRE